VLRGSGKSQGYWSRPLVRLGSEIHCYLGIIAHDRTQPPGCHPRWTLGRPNRRLPFTYGGAFLLGTIGL